MVTITELGHPSRINIAEHKYLPIVIIITLAHTSLVSISEAKHPTIVNGGDWYPLIVSKRGTLVILPY